jgi:SH3-like domain-containing protein
MKTSWSTSCLSVATLLLVTASALAQDETVPEETRRLFVSDKLVLNVYAEADQSSSRVATIETGDAVDELERTENYARVRLQDGREGWVGSNYLTDDAPAAVQLRELQRQQKSAAQGADKKSAEEIARLKKESESLQAQIKELKAAAAAPPPAPDDGVLEGAATTPQTLTAAAPAGTGSALWIWPIVVVLAAGLAYAAGYQSLARKLRKKFGGLRIY